MRRAYALLLAHFGHLHWWPGETAFEVCVGAIQQLCERALDEQPRSERLDYWQDFHAQLVMVGKHFCRPGRALCDHCPLKPLLPARP